MAKITFLQPQHMLFSIDWNSVWKVVTQSDKIARVIDAGEGRYQLTFTGEFVYEAASMQGRATGMTITIDGVDLVTISGMSEDAAALQQKLMTMEALDLLGHLLRGNDAVAGTAGADLLIGFAGNDSITGGAGADTMMGGAGNDIYEVNSTADQVREMPMKSSDPPDPGGVDLVQSAITYRLGSYLENLTLTGAKAISGSGNSLANVITGNAAANTLDGDTGNDRLYGGAGQDKLLGSWGNDKLDGGTGADTMEGGYGNDTYVVNDTKDKALEVIVAPGAVIDAGGIDLVQSSASFTLGAYVEKLTLTGTRAISGVGNTLDNTLSGNAAANTLKGVSGNDTIAGGGGNDVLNGGAGRDLLTGGAGADVFDFDKVTDSNASARDTIKDFLRGTDKIDLTTIDADGAVSGNGVFTFVGTKAFSANATGQLRYAVSSSGVVVYGSTDADATAEFQIILTGVSALGAADFAL